MSELVDASNIYCRLKQGQHVRSSDGREWTVCYSFLDGYGVVEGLRDLKNLPDEDLPEPHAMLRDPYKSADLPCIGARVEVLE